MEIVQHAIRLPTTRSRTLPRILRVLIALRVLATGSFFYVVRDIEPDVGTATLHRVFWRVVNALVTHVKEFVQMPRGDRVSRVKQGSCAIAG